MVSWQARRISAFTSSCVLSCPLTPTIPPPAAAAVRTKLDFSLDRTIINLVYFLSTNLICFIRLFLIIKVIYARLLENPNKKGCSWNPMKAESTYPPNGAPTLNRVLMWICTSCVRRELLTGSHSVKMMGWKTQPSFIFTVTLDYQWMNALGCEASTPFPSKPSPHIPGSRTTGYSDAKGSGRNTRLYFRQ